MRAIFETDVTSGRLGNVDSVTAATLDKALGGRPIDEAEALHLLRVPAGGLAALLAVAGHVRDRCKGRTVTYSPKVFLPITNLCRDFCAYCTFRKNPEDPGAWTMLPEEVRSACAAARRLGCIEALMCLGDKPERAFAGYRSTLAVLGHGSTIEYVERCCAIAIEEGLLPHTNAGLMTRDEMRRAKAVNASLGLMLENVSPRLRARGGPHHHAPDKDPDLRLRMMREAGELQIAFTTGILLGIGETDAERVASIAAIRDLHDRYGHIQEIIVQNFRAKPSTPMAAASEPENEVTARVVAVTRLVLPTMNVQVPPNLNPYDLRLFLAAGINDWGGVSPVTRDFVNPEAPWPQVAVLRSTCAAEGFSLQPRLPIYPEYLERPGFLDPALREPVAMLSAQRGVPYAL
jgi:FO synthase subunit 1